MRSQSRTVLILAVVALIVATLRYFMKGWVEPLAWPPIVGSLLASITVVLLVGLVIIFVREGRAAQGSYWHAAVWFAVLAAWSQALVIAGILITAKTGSATYYEEMMGAHVSLPPVRHALSHAGAFFVVAVIGSIIGVPIYLLAKRGRGANPAAAN